MSGKPIRNISVRVDESTYEKILDRAVEADRSINYIAAKAFRQFLGIYKKGGEQDVGNESR